MSTLDGDDCACMMVRSPVLSGKSGVLGDNADSVARFARSSRKIGIFNLYKFSSSFRSRSKCQSLLIMGPKASGSLGGAAPSFAFSGQTCD